MTRGSCCGAWRPSSGQHRGGEKSRTENRARGFSCAPMCELSALELQTVRLRLPPCTSEAATWSTLSR